MVISQKRLIAFSSAAVLGAAGVIIGGSIVSGGDPRPAVVDGRLTDDLRVDTASFASGDQFPILPLEPIVDVYEGYQIIVGRYGGLESVTAELNGAALTVDASDEAFVLTVGQVDGGGPATLLLTERFVEGGTVTLPYTVYIGNHNLASMTTRKSDSTPPLWTVSLSYGAGEGEVGFIDGNEAAATTPAAIAGLPNGSVAVLDTANQRVVTVMPDGSVRPMVTLPSGAFVAFATSSDSSSTMAIDPVNATAVDLASGARHELPAVVRGLSLATNYSLDGDTLFANNPGDGLQYSIGSTDGRSLDGVVQRRADAGRIVANARASTLTVQTSPDAVPLDIAIDGDDLAVLDQLKLSDGRMVGLIAIKSGGTWITELLTTDGTNTTRTPVVLDGRFSMTSYLAAIDGAVVVADPGLKTFDLTAYAI